MQYSLVPASLPMPTAWIDVEKPGCKYLELKSALILMARFSNR
jgi:hypothetical protein